MRFQELESETFALGHRFWVQDALLFSLDTAAPVLLLAEFLSFFRLPKTPNHVVRVSFQSLVGKATLRWRPLQDCHSHSLKTLQGFGA